MGILKPLWFGFMLTVMITGIALTANRSLPDELSRVSLRINGQSYNPDQTSLKIQSEANSGYDCNLKVYMVEDESRYKDYTNYYRYQYGFLDFAFDTVLSLAYQETYQETKIWDARAAGFASDADSAFVRQDNMTAIAVLFNTEDGGTGYSDPYFEHPEGAPFTIHFADACAAASHNNPGWDTAWGISTHTVFIEEGTEHT